MIEKIGVDVKVDWHGHNDRGLGLSNALVAAFDGKVDRIHGTCLGIGERAGNTPIDQILINIKTMGLLDRNLIKLGEYCQFVSRVTGFPIPNNYPTFGRDAFRTASGIHASAILKAIHKVEDSELADLVYSAIPASMVGLKQQIDIGPQSGKANVLFWLGEKGIEPNDDLVISILEAGKRSDRCLTDEEIVGIIQSHDSGTLAG